MSLSFRSFAESPAFCGLTLSPLAAAIADASDGIATTIEDDRAIDHFGCLASDLPTTARRTIAVRAGGRGGKTSRLLAPKALHAAWTVPLPTLQRGEIASAVIVAPDMKLARQALSFVTGYVESSKVLTRALVGEPTKDAIELRRPDGKIVRVEVLAATRGGRAVRGRTLVFAGLDEACFFFDEASGVVNDVELYRALLQRIVEGGQVWIVSTPWIADVGLLETVVAKNFGVHEHALVAVAPTRALNPSWDPTGEIERDLREQDPDAAAREIDAVPMSGGAGVFFDPIAIRQCVNESRPTTIPRPDGSRVAFGADVAFERDSSALVGVARRGDAYRVLTLDELRPTPGHPLKPKAVVDAFADIVKRYGANGFVSDAHYRMAVREHLEPHDLAFFDAPGGDKKIDVYLRAKDLIHAGKVELPNHPRLLSQLRAVVSKPRPGGGFTVSSPRKSGGGHGDLVSALVLALWRASREPAASQRQRFIPPLATRDFNATGDAAFEPTSIAGTAAPTVHDGSKPHDLAAYVAGLADSFARER